MSDETQLTRESVLDYLQTLEQARLVELFYAATAHLSLTRRLPDGRLECERLVMAESNWDSEELYVEYIGLPTQRAYLETNASEIDSCYESGTCAGCGVNVRSFAKEANCPVCGSRVGLG